VRIGVSTYGLAVPSNRVLASALAAATAVLAVGGEALVLTHRAGALGLMLIALAAAAGVAAWVALGAPARRVDSRAH
jgi:hypothetical protein